MKKNGTMNLYLRRDKLTDVGIEMRTDQDGVHFRIPLHAGPTFHQDFYKNAEAMGISETAMEELHEDVNLFLARRMIMGAVR